MPRGDRTGPAGMGPMTGRAAGYCAGYGVPGYANPAFGRGFGRGYGRGWGMGMGLGFRGGRGRGWVGPAVAPAGGYWGPGYAPNTPYVPQAPSPQQEMEYLRQQAEEMGQMLEQIQNRITELEKEEGKKS